MPIEDRVTEKILTAYYNNYYQKRTYTKNLDHPQRSTLLFSNSRVYNLSGFVENLHRAKLAERAPLEETNFNLFTVLLIFH